MLPYIPYMDPMGMLSSLLLHRVYLGDVCRAKMVRHGVACSARAAARGAETTAEDARVAWRGAGCGGLSTWMGSP